MIAVFVRNYQDYQNLNLYPPNQFVRITSTESLMGIKFTALITIGGWFLNNELTEAYDSLQARQPELFKV